MKVQSKATIKEERIKQAHKELKKKCLELNNKYDPFIWYNREGSFKGVIQVGWSKDIECRLDLEVENFTFFEDGEEINKKLGWKIKETIN